MNFQEFHEREQEHLRKWRAFSLRLKAWMQKEPHPHEYEVRLVLIDAAQNSENPICAIERVERHG